MDARRTRTRSPLPYLLPALVAGVVGGCGVGVTAEGDNPPQAADPEVGGEPVGAESGVALGAQEVDTVLHLVHSGLGEARRVTVRDEASWAAMWEELHAHLDPRPEAPAVDFADRVVVVAALGTRPSGGYDVGFGRLSVQGDTLFATVREQVPGPTCAVTMALTSPVVGVALPDAATTVFVEASDTVSCGQE